MIQRKFQNTRLPFRKFLRKAGLADQEIEVFTAQRQDSRRNPLLDQTDILALTTFLGEDSFDKELGDSYFFTMARPRQHLGFQNRIDMQALRKFLKEGGLSEQEIEDYISQNQVNPVVKSNHSQGEAEKSRLKKFLKEGGLSDQDAEAYIAQNNKENVPKTANRFSNDQTDLSTLKKFLREAGLKSKEIETYIAQNYPNKRPRTDEEDPNTRNRRMSLDFEEEKEMKPIRYPRMQPHQVLNPTYVREVSQEPQQKKKEDCLICLDEVSSDKRIKFMNCKHVFHRGCIEIYVVERIKSRAFPIVCPIPDCKREMAVPDIKGSIHKQIKYRKLFDEYALKFFLETHPNDYAYCLTPSCEYAVFMGGGCYSHGEEYRFNCLKCKKSYCINCKTKWHQGMTCNQFKQQKDVQNDNLFIALANNKGFKQCPQCRYMIEKTQGCNQMTCSKCRTPFCYGCGLRRDGSCRC